MSAARDIGMGLDTGVVIHTLRPAGHERLATRLRNAARSRGAEAHPDGTRARDILATGSHDSMLNSLISRVQDNRDLSEDDHVSETSPQAVHPPTAAAPSGGGVDATMPQVFKVGDLCDDRIIPRRSASLPQAAALQKRPRSISDRRDDRHLRRPGHPPFVEKVVSSQSCSTSGRAGSRCARELRE